MASVPEKRDSKLRLVTEPREPVEAATVISKHSQQSSSSHPLQPEQLGKHLRGRRLAHFEVLDQIGVGGMAAVLRARDTQLDRIVALKILPPDAANDPENVKRFHQEARAAAKLDHENIARVFFCGEDQDLHFIAFEFVEGTNLRNLIDKRGPLPVSEAIRYMLQVATGLEHAAARGVVHRDIKPSNIIITPNGRAKLVDMGLARSIDRSVGDLTQSGMTLGTFDYISPEQAMEPRDADVRSDIYSLGCTLYHAVTGQAPVPTSAAPLKKVYYHQHILPTDPRAIIPDFPDDVAMVIGRMMAKDPSDRYQTPTLLIQHLVQIARHHGAADEVPEGVMYADPAFPTKPTARPLTLAIVAAVTLAIVLLIVSLAPPTQTSTAPRNVDPKERVESKAAPHAKSDETAAPRPSDSGGSIRTVADLEKALRRGGEIVLDHNLQVSGTPLSFVGAGRSGLKDLTLTSADPKKPVTLSFDLGSNAMAGLAIQGGHVTLKDLRIEWKSAASSEASAISVKGNASLNLTRCVIRQAGMPALTPRRAPLASVLVDATETPGTKPRVTVNESFFDVDSDQPGHAALALNGPVDLLARNCAFSPHAAVVHLRSQCKLATTRVELDQCAAFVVHGPVVRGEAKASAHLVVARSVFSRPDNTPLPREGPGPDLLSQAEAAPLRYEGDSNLYHHLNALWGGGVPLKASLEDFQREVAKLGKDRNSSLLKDLDNSPWVSKSPRSESDPALMFQLRYRYRELGLERCAWGEMPASPIEKGPTLRPNEKIVVATPDEADETPGAIASLAEAFAGARNGDVFLLKHGEAMPVFELLPTSVKPGLSVTLEPYPGCAPVLKLDRQARDRDAALFRVAEGQLHFRGLHFVIEPKEGYLSQSVVQLGESAECTFHDCVATLRAKGVPTQLISFIDPEDVMRVDTPLRPTARVELKDTFVRGAGDLVNVRAGHSLRLTVDNSLVALSGSLLQVQGQARDALVPPNVSTTLRGASLFLGESLLSLKAARLGKSLPRAKLDADDCLFLSLAGRPLVSLETPEVASDPLVTKFFEPRGQHNFYANFGRFYEQQHSDGTLLPVSLDAAQWRENFKEAESRYEPLAIPGLESMRTLSDLLPSQFRLPDPDVGTFGFTKAPALDHLLTSLPTEPRP